MLLVSYIVRPKKGNRWKAYLLIPIYLLLTSGLYVFIFVSDISNYISWCQKQINFLFSGIQITHVIVLLLMFLFNYLVFILIKLIFKYVISKLKFIPPPYYMNVKENGEFYLLPKYWYYPTIFRNLTAALFLIILLYSFFFKINFELFILDIFLVFSFELMILFPKNKIKIPKLDFTFDPKNNEDDEVLKNFAQFETFFNEIQSDADLKENIQLSLSQKIRVIRDSD